MAQVNSPKDFMQIAFNLAKKHSGLTFSNPSVGCVVARDGRIISSASTEVFGRPHAENIALSGNQDFEGAELFVTLEPCNHFGKTPPCVHSILNAKIKRVFVAVRDTDKRVDGNGIEAIKAAGIEVIEGILEEEITAFYEPYLTAKLRKSPFVSVKIICSQDGKIATKTNSSKWISDAQSRLFTNFLRHKYDGILVGGETYRQDSPFLTCRTEGLLEFSPKRFVLSNSLQKCEGFNVVKGKFKAFLPEIYKNFQVNHLLIEGGSNVITQALEEDVVDEILIAHAPFFIGKDGKDAVLMEGLTEITQAKKFKLQKNFQFGELIFTLLRKF